MVKPRVRVRPDSVMSTRPVPAQTHAFSDMNFTLYGLLLGATGMATLNATDTISTRLVATFTNEPSGM